MLENLAIEAGPSRFARALGVLIIGALAITPAAMLPAPAPSVALRGACTISPVRPHTPHTTIRTRAAGVNPRFLQRDLDRTAVPAR